MVRNCYKYLPLPCVQCQHVLDTEMKLQQQRSITLYNDVISVESLVVKVFKSIATIDSLY